jgi:Ca-activated chloride channel family protein
LWLLAAVAVAGWRVYAKRRRAGLLFSPASQLGKLPRTWRAHVSGVLPALLLLGLICLVIALARPRTTLSRRARKSDVIAIEMVVDVSGSMRALDMSDIVGRKIKKERTRLDAVKKAFGEFVKRRPGDLVGLVTFGGFASTRAPLTLDHNALLHVLQGVEIPSESYDGRGGIVNQEDLMTAIGDGLATACARINSAEPKSKIIVLLSDGESNTGIVQPEEAIEVAKALKIKVYTIGVGSSGNAPMKVKDAYGRERIMSSRVFLDEALLRKIAASTGGQYFNVLDPEGLEKAMEQIEELEKTTIKREMYEEHNELFMWMLLPGLCLVVMGTGLNVLVTRRIV